jgi:hypothetical protein
MIRTLQAEIPPMPEEIVVKPELPPPYNPKFKEVPKITIGQQPPPEKEDKKNSQKMQPKKQTLKKGEKPPRIFKFMNEADQTKKKEGS